MEIRLSRLSPEQIGEICGAALPKSWLTPDKLAEIYEHTGGNCFLLREFLNCYDSNDWSSKLDRSVSDIAESRMLSLSEDEAHLLDCAAAFPEEAPFEPLKELSGFRDNELVSLCERLRMKGLLYERPSGGAYVIMFRYALVKKRICGAMSGLKWWNLHKRLLEYYKTHSENPHGRKNLALVAHHAGDAMTELEARVEDLKSHFEFNHELFPKLSDAELFGTSRTLNDTFLTGDYLSEAWELLDSLVRKRGRTPELLECERALLTLKGGYLRWNGNYDDAASYLEGAMPMARRSRFRDEAMAEVLEQYCYIGIQKDDAKLLRKSVHKFCRLARKRHWRRLMGTGFRFLAILRIMEGDYDRAGRLLSMSAGVFEELEAKGHGYTISVIAAMHYHGDIAMHTGNYGEAVSCYGRCARMCEANGFYRGICLHLAKAAWCEIRLGLMKEAREHLALAAPFLEGFQSRRGAGICGGEIVFGLVALFDMWDGMPRASCANLRNAEDLSGIMHKPLWNAILLCIKALLRDSGEPALLKMLPLEADAYLREAEEILRRVGFLHELEAFGALRAYSHLKSGT
jgi:tetratricopeptide (TPR) repeat protein